MNIVANDNSCDKVKASCAKECRVISLYLSGWNVTNCIYRTVTFIWCPIGSMNYCLFFNSEPIFDLYLFFMRWRENDYVQIRMCFEFLKSENFLSNFTQTIVFRVTIPNSWFGLGKQKLKFWSIRLISFRFLQIY